MFLLRLLGTRFHGSIRREVILACEIGNEALLAAISIHDCTARVEQVNYAEGQFILDTKSGALHLASCTEYCEPHFCLYHDHRSMPENTANNLWHFVNTALFHGHYSILPTLFDKRLPYSRVSRRTLLFLHDLVFEKLCARNKFVEDCHPVLYKLIRLLEEELDEADAYHSTSGSISEYPRVLRLLQSREAIRILACHFYIPLDIQKLLFTQLIA
jgi:hypothetical protein